MFTIHLILFTDRLNIFDLKCNGEATIEACATGRHSRQRVDIWYAVYTMDKNL